MLGCGNGSGQLERIGGTQGVHTEQASGCYSYACDRLDLVPGAFQHVETLQNLGYTYVIDRSLAL